MSFLLSTKRTFLIHDDLLVVGADVAMTVAFRYGFVLPVAWLQLLNDDEHVDTAELREARDGLLDVSDVEVVDEDEDENETSESRDVELTSEVWSRATAPTAAEVKSKARSNRLCEASARQYESDESDESASDDSTSRLCFNQI